MSLPKPPMFYGGWIQHDPDGFWDPNDTPHPENALIMPAELTEGDGVAYIMEDSPSYVHEDDASDLAWHRLDNGGTITHYALNARHPIYLDTETVPHPDPIEELASLPGFGEWS